MITRQSLRNYMRNLVDRFFKILPLWEEGEETLPAYLDSMLIVWLPEYDVRIASRS